MQLTAIFIYFLGIKNAVFLNGNTTAKTECYSQNDVICFQQILIYILEKCKNNEIDIPWQIWDISSGLI